MTTPKPADNVVQLPSGRKDETVKAVTDFAREHPVAIVAGGLAIGLIAGAIFAPRTRGRLARSAMALTEAAAVAGLELGRQALERAEDAGEGLRKQGSAIADKAAQLKGPAGEAVDSAGEAAQRLLRKAIDLAGRIRS